jgi:hypothetical protein
MVLKLHRVILAAGSDYFKMRLCTPSSSEGLQYTDGDRVLVERIPAGDERAMEAYLEFLYKDGLDETLTLLEILTVLKVSLIIRLLYVGGACFLTSTVSFGLRKKGPELYLGMDSAPLLRNILV